MATVGFNAMGQQFSFLGEVALNFPAQRSFPGAADRNVEGHRGCDDDDQKSRQQFEENPICHVILTPGSPIIIALVSDFLGAILEIRSGSPRPARS